MSIKSIEQGNLISGFYKEMQKNYEQMLVCKNNIKQNIDSMKAIELFETLANPEEKTLIAEYDYICSEINNIIGG